MQLEVFDAIAEAYDLGAHAGIAELGALHDTDARRTAETTPNTHAVDQLATETVDLATQTHRRMLRGVEYGDRQDCRRTAPGSRRTRRLQAASEQGARTDRLLTAVHSLMPPRNSMPPKPSWASNSLT